MDGGAASPSVAAHAPSRRFSRDLPLVENMEASEVEQSARTKGSDAGGEMMLGSVEEGQSNASSPDAEGFGVSASWVGSKDAAAGFTDSRAWSSGNWVSSKSDCPLETWSKSKSEACILTAVARSMKKKRQRDMVDEKRDAEIFQLETASYM